MLDFMPFDNGQKRALIRHCWSVFSHSQFYFTLSLHAMRSKWLYSVLSLIAYLYILSASAASSSSSHDVVNRNKNVKKDDEHIGSDSDETMMTEIPNDESDNDQKNRHKNQRLTLIAYASHEGPARHLMHFAKQYGLELHLIGVNKPWGGFNDKINGFYNFINSIDNTHNESIIMILDAYDTVPICKSSDLLTKFNSFDADIVMSTGKDCWPDPNVGTFLTERLSEEEKESHKFFPWFLCPNSGAIMGRHDAMLTMFRRVQKLVSIGNGSCNDFEGNKFTKNTQSGMLI